MTAVTFAAVGIALYAGHQVGDHLAQTDAWAGAKAASKPREWMPAMAWHLATYHAALAAFLAALPLVGVHLSLPRVAAGLVFSAVTHGFLDRRWPVRWLLRHTGSAEFADRTAPICGMYLADQSLHVACLFVAALLIGGAA